jgi:hypothetical protein
MPNLQEFNTIDGKVKYGDIAYAILPGYTYLIKTMIAELPCEPFDGFVVRIDTGENPNVFLTEEDIRKFVYVDERRANMDFKLGR